jgi:hypothetical protein
MTMSLPSTTSSGDCVLAVTGRGWVLQATSPCGCSGRRRPKSGAKVAHTRTAAQLPYQVVTDVLRLATAVAREGISTERLSDRGKLAKRCSVLGEQADEIVDCRLSRVRCECSFWLV